MITYGCQKKLGGDDIRSAQCERTRVTLQKHKSIRNHQSEFQPRQDGFIAFRETEGNIHHSQSGMEKVVSEFYNHLYGATGRVQFNVPPPNEPCPSIFTKEVEYAVQHSTNGTSPDFDRITGELLKKWVNIGK